ncbi:lysozyme inhibitor LprI family protein [Dichotomicrobium thermohalophilum]|uniref:Lysozyme inhibitor LprI N-terminal domain-containing protein n=1 Tax=Dichotomicrobium thermohalophilum TaxID=933063 RepID=A0A397Q5P8_9HYPH|nr:hypothetical protein [Dichotomicrobium thermohalophilum]RIA56378.1 hypothetical protein BXY53_1484 [Dichotomicrobium thermohalophilum]
MRFAVAFAVFLGLGASQAAAQSFDCSKARLAAELAVCDSPRLSRLDEEMSALYFGLPYVVRDEIKGAQRRWLRRRNACGYDERCIEEAYLRRIEVLSQF